MNYLLRIVLLSGLNVLLVLPSFSQGLSFSYLIPKDGYLSAPISPFSIRGIGVDMGFIGIETGFSLYYMGGLGMKGLPFDAGKPLTGPHMSLLIPLQLGLIINGKFVSMRLKGGGFGLWHINPRINEGNMDRALRDYQSWVVLNSDLKMDNSLGGGWIVDTSLEFHVADNFSISTEFSYLKGHTKSSLEGTYTGADNSGSLQTLSASFHDSKISLEGFEVSIGVVVDM
ncbi:MAG: hypothetical protein O2951_12015 [Bacteroidetes bacterium]|nr:hypothetical protein [Bacteroidota bacterium]